MSTTQHVDVCSSQRRSISRVKAGAVAGEGRGGAGPPASPLLLRLLCCSSAVLLLGGAAASAAPNNCRINQQPTMYLLPMSPVLPTLRQPPPPSAACLKPLINIITAESLNLVTLVHHRTTQSRHEP